MTTEEKEEHKKVHIALHNALDELVADWIQNTGGFPSQSTILHLMSWAHAQIENPTGTGVVGVTGVQNGGELCQIARKHVLGKD